MMAEMYIRTCQSCGNRQTAKPVGSYVGASESWRRVKCRECKSEDLDYGSYQQVDPATLEHLPFPDDDDDDNGGED